MLDLLRPPPIRPGDRVGLLAPASPCPANEVEAGCAILQKLGLEVVINVGPEDFKPGYLAGSDEYRASCFNEFVQDSVIKGLFCARGGYGSPRILPRLDYEQLRRTPKAIVGFSDLTALLLSCSHQAGVVTFHGPTASSLAAADSESVQSLWTALSSAEPIVLHLSDALCLRHGKAVGSVFGGNLTTLCHLLGTPFLPPLSECILFLEDRGEAMYRIDRMLTQLILTGALDNLSALILADFSDSGPRHQLNELVQELLASTSFPIISGVPVGHERRNLTLPLGLVATLDTDAGILAYHEAATAP